MKRETEYAPNRRALLLGLGAMLATPAIARANLPGVRRLSMTNANTGESFSDVYCVEGIYQPEAMDALDRLMRDHHADEAMMMDVRLYDLLFRVQERLDSAEKLRITSAFRTPATNEALRRRNRWAARNSLHIKGMAADFHLPGRSASALAKAARTERMGGVGTYSGARFIHVDVGEVRSWRR